MESWLNETGLENSSFATWETTSLASSTRRVNELFLPWNNPRNVVDQETRDDVLFVIDCVLCPIFTVLGLMGNTMSLVVLLHHNMRGSVDVILAAMAVSDSIFLATTMVRRAKCIVSAVAGYLTAEWYNVRIFNTMFYLNTAFSRITTLLTVLITVNRFIAVVFPLKAKLLCTRKRMIWAILAIYISCLLVLIPVAMFYEEAQVFDRNLKAMRPYLARSTIYVANHDFMLGYARTFLVIVYRYIPALILLLLNGFIIISLKRTSALRKQMSQKEFVNQDKDQRKVTRMLLIISMLFLITLLPGCAVLLGSTIDINYQFMSTYHNLFMLTSGVALLLEVNNSSVNFIVYMCLSKTFSKTYVKLFCCCWKRSQTSDPSFVKDTASTGLPSTEQVVNGVVSTEKI